MGKNPRVAVIVLQYVVAGVSIARRRQVGFRVLVMQLLFTAVEAMGIVANANKVFPTDVIEIVHGYHELVRIGSNGPAHIHRFAWRSANRRGDCRLLRHLQGGVNGGASPLDVDGNVTSCTHRSGEE